MCPPDDPAWDIFAKGCTLGINQCEQEGTRARVMKYQPRNISELSAFVAAIRPGGASFYKQFESREPFSYGVKSFDDLIQTKEFPYSFLLYQEQVMRALNYAGIDMADCYTAIKNIAKKRVEKVLAYKDTFIKGFGESIIREEHKTAEEAQSLAENLWGVIEDSAMYSFNASHSYCVALDSLYGAWLKAHYPLAFYETYITLMEEKGDKDKINAAKEEAESYFGIRFAPMRFRQDNRSIHADDTSSVMINTVGSIKGYGVTIGKTLYECGKHSFNSFTDLLAAMDKKGIKEAKFKPLILIDYFSEFGNQRELLEIARAWDFFKQGNSKSVRRSLIDSNPALSEIVNKHTIHTLKSGEEAQCYTFQTPQDVMECLYECEAYIRKLHLDDLDARTKIQNSIDILGYCDVCTGISSDRRRLLITDVIPLKNNGDLWAYRLSTKSIGSGKSARVTVKTELYNNSPINKGDIVRVHDLYKNKAGYWYLTSYEVEQ